ncbi:MAG: hypothetical protein IPN46_13965 [Saprospiraceae bacterium]|nr:hypothetical protein [Saprospiraceae bacterium]
MVWNKRLFIFLPEFLLKTVTKKFGSKTMETIGSETNENVRPDIMYEIKMSYSEYKNGIWTPKKTSETYTVKGSNGYEFCEVLSKYNYRATIENSKVVLKFYHNLLSSMIEGGLDYFEFDGSALTNISDDDKLLENYNPYSPTDNFHYIGNKIGDNEILPNYTFDESNRIISNLGLFKHEFTDMLIKTISIKDLKDFFNYCNVYRVTNKDIDFGAYTTDLGESIFHELKKAYSIYNWELFFYLPIAIAENLNKNQQFEEAMKWYHFVFHPFESGIEANRFWKFLPFKNTDSSNYLESFFKLLQPNSSVKAIDEWRDNPFNPHIIARSRPSAYMKWVVMRYLITFWIGEIICIAKIPWRLSTMQHNCMYLPGIY